MTSKKEQKHKKQSSKDSSISLIQDRNISSQELGWDVLVVRDYDSVRINSLISYDVVIIEYNVAQKADELIRKIRASVVDEVYLIPIYIHSVKKQILNTTLDLADGQIDTIDIDPIKEEIGRFKEYINEFKQIQSDFVGKNLLLKLLRYMISRNRSLTPIPSHLSLTGYSYPFLEASIEDDQYKEIDSILDAAIERGFMTPNYIDLVHVCSNCHSGFINYREVCPKCQTRKLTTQHSIHHYVCGYVGPEADFLQGDKLVCPKCSRQLRHIGVDYDKPSVIMECENGHVFQEPDMETLCMRCHTQGDLNSLIDYSVNEYAISNIGIGVAKSGRKKSEEPVEIQGVITYPLFKSLIKLEGERQKITHSLITISYVNFVFSTQTLKKELNNYKEFLNGLIILFRNLLEPTDIITLPVDDIILVFSAEAKAEDTIKRLESALQEVKSNMIENNKLNVEDKLFVNSYDMTEEIGADGIFTQISNEVNIQ